MSLQDSHAGLPSATNSLAPNSASEAEKALKPSPDKGRSFARISPDISELTLNLTPCASRLYEWLLQQKRSGSPQEVFLEEFAKTTENRRRGRPYCLPHIKRALKELLDSELVELVLRYSAKIFKLIAHDSRTFSSKNEMKMSQDLTKKSKIEASNPCATVGLNRENQRKNTDPAKSKIERPVLKNREEGLVEAQPSETAQSPTAIVNPPTAHHPELLKEVEATLQQPLSTHLQQQILAFTISHVRDALDSYREAKQQPSPIRNPQAWFMAALKRAYKPNRSVQGQQPAQTVTTGARNGRQQPPQGFREWFALAQPAGVALGSSYLNGEFCIHTPTGWEPWIEMQQIWSLARLQMLVPGAELAAT